MDYINASIGEVDPLEANKKKYFQRVLCYCLHFRIMQGNLIQYQVDVCERTALPACLSLSLSPSDIPEGLGKTNGNGFDRYCQCTMIQYPWNWWLRIKLTLTLAPILIRQTCFLTSRLPYGTLDDFFSQLCGPTRDWRYTETQIHNYLAPLEFKTNDAIHDNNQYHQFIKVILSWT